MNLGDRLLAMLSRYWVHRAGIRENDEDGAISRDRVWRMGYAAGLRDALRDVTSTLGHLNTLEGFELPSPDKAGLALRYELPVAWSTDLQAIESRQPFELPRVQTVTLSKSQECDGAGGIEWCWRVMPATLWSGVKVARNNDA